MNEVPSQELTEKELSSAKEKAPRHDGIHMEKIQQCWPTIGVDFLLMLCKGMENGALPEGITKGLISLISKEGNSKDLNYWGPITLLTASYKVFAKTLQLRLQPILRDVISPEQTTFLLLQFILDNIVLTPKTLHWYRVTRQSTIFLKLESHDKVVWRFFFNTMQRMNVNEKFIKWVKLLFENAMATIKSQRKPG